MKPRNEVITDLLELLKPKDTVYCSMRSVARSGMSRRVDFHIVKDGKTLPITDLMQQLDGAKVDGKGLLIPGCGFDAGHHAVYALGRKLWPNGTAEPHSTRNGAHDKSGGYALRAEWL